MSPENGPVGESPPYLVSHCHVGQQHELLDQSVAEGQRWRGRRGIKCLIGTKLTVFCMSKCSQVFASSTRFSHLWLVLFGSQYILLYLNTVDIIIFRTSFMLSAIQTDHLLLSFCTYTSHPLGRPVSLFRVNLSFG